MAPLLALVIIYLGWTTAFGLYGPDEPRYASIARAMAATGDWITPRLDGEAWLEKPPLLYWMSAIGFRLGLGPESAPRVPLALASVCFLIWFRFYLRRWLSDGQAFCAAAMLATSAGWIGYSYVAVTDVPLTICFAAAMLVSLAWIEGGRARDAVLAGALFGLAVLAKALVPFVFVYSPAMLIVTQGFTWAEFFETTIGCLIGIVMLAAALTGYGLAPMVQWQRLLLFVASVLVITPSRTLTIIGLLLAVPVVALQIMSPDRGKPVIPRSA